MPLKTVKASNFGPHGNFGLFSTSSVASVNESCTKNKQNQICRSKVFLQLLFSSFFCRTRFNDSKPCWKRGPKLGALTVQKLYTSHPVKVQIGKGSRKKQAHVTWELEISISLILNDVWTIQSSCTYFSSSIHIFFVSTEAFLSWELKTKWVVNERTFCTIVSKDLG
jgi:hypothetical protein